MRGNQIHFEVEEADRIVVTRFEGWERQGECALEFLSDLIENWRDLMVGRSGGISIRDYPPDADWVDSLDLSFRAEALWRSTNGRRQDVAAGTLATQ
jgi:hypothetical protein